MKTFIKDYSGFLKESHTPKIIDTILDKIGKYGMESLTSMERDALAEYSKVGDIPITGKELKNLGNRLDSMLDYNPRGEEFFSDLGMDFSGWSDEEINNDRMNIIWNDLTPELAEDFIVYSKMDRKTIEDQSGSLPGELPEHLLPKFKEWIDYINLY